jgi:hypothetical protein
MRNAAGPGDLIVNLGEPLPVKHIRWYRLTA